MKRALFHILAAVFGVLAMSGCGKGKPVIPAGVMSDIYFDMFVTDQWIMDNSEMRSKADSMLVYEPIFNKYGYSTEDYDRSVSYYLARPEKYLKIAETTVKRFKDEIGRLERRQEEIKQIQLNRSIYNYRQKDFAEDSVRWSFGTMKEIIDSILIEHKWIISQENTDTLQTTSNTAQ